jgi:hypothetical protein
VEDAPSVDLFLPSFESISNVSSGNIFYDLVSSSHSHFVLADALGPVFTLALSRRRHFLS